MSGVRDVPMPPDVLEKTIVAQERMLREDEADLAAAIAALRVLIRSESAPSEMERRRGAIEAGIEARRVVADYDAKHTKRKLTRGEIDDIGAPYFGESYPQKPWPEERGQ